MFSLENTQKWSKIERPHDLLCWCWWNPGLFGQFLAHFGQKTIQVCISLPILYRALGDLCDPLQLTTLANKLCNYLINPIVYHSNLYQKLGQDNVNFLFYSQRKSTSLCSTKYYVRIVDILYYGNFFQHGKKFLS